MGVSAVAGIIGALLAATALLDVWTTILHPDGEGPIARVIRSGVWRASSWVATRWPAAGRRLLAQAGPLLLAGTFVLWIALLNLGLALVVWPHLAGFHRVEGTGGLGFLDGLYYTAGTLSVLGFGDIVPTTAALKLFSVVVAGLGFTLFTGLTTYLIQVINGVAVRNRFALAVHDQTRDLGGGGVIARSLAEEGVAQTRRRCEEWTEALRALEDIVHRYPIAALTYRSWRRTYSGSTPPASWCTWSPRCTTSPKPAWRRCWPAAPRRGAGWKWPPSTSAWRCCGCRTPSPTGTCPPTPPTGSTSRA